jgi:tetratricopeptide (TPR) repeat protein
MTSQAEVHKSKSEYNEAHQIQTQILCEAMDCDTYTHAFALLNLAEISVSIGAPRDNIEKTIENARHMLQTTLEMTMCDTILAALYLREGETATAMTLFKRCLKSWEHQEVKSYCLERLANVNSWDAVNQMSTWTTVFLVHALRSKEKLGINKALQFMGDVFLANDNEMTAVSLYTIALAGFIGMDVHRSRAECLLRLGDISIAHGALLRAVGLWKMARPLFERSVQAKQVILIDERLAGVSTEILEQHSKAQVAGLEGAEPSTVAV